MPSGNIDFEMQNTEFRKTSDDPVALITINVAASLGGGKQAILMYMNRAPGTYAVASNPDPDGGVRGPMAFQFAKGCMAIDTNAGTLFMNSNASAPSWTAQV